MILPESHQGADNPAQKSANEPASDAKPDFKVAALEWFQLGLAVIPIVPLMKKTAVTWDWLDGLSDEKISEHWTMHPNHEVGCITGDELIVFDADTPQAIVALAEIEKAFDLTPSWVNRTRRGEHHYFRRAPGTYAKSDAHATTEHPERIDVKTGRAMVVLPPSTGKHVELREAEHASALPEVSQAFIDAIFRHNGRQAPRPAPESYPIEADGDAHLPAQRDLSKLLEHLTADLPYADWLTVLLAGHWAYGGSQDGFELVDRWSANGTTYPGSAEMYKKWQSFKGHHGASVTIASACRVARDHGVNLERISGSSWEAFDVAATEVVEATSDAPRSPVAEIPDAIHTSVFSKYSLIGFSQELAREVDEETFVLEPLALRGQATVWYAGPNAGKTLITLNRIVCAITSGLVEPGQVFYVNADDTSHGLLIKLTLAERYGFNMLAPGYRDFEPKQFLKMLRQASKDGTAREIILVLDTLKKFTDLMDKPTASGFTNVVRSFVSRGGTLIGLAHVNKKKGVDGRSVHAGTTDIKDDFDCAYVVDVIDNGRESGTRIVEFSNEKRRGTVADVVRFSYRVGEGVSYLEMLSSVAVEALPVGANGVPVSAADDDAEYVSIVEHSIRAGLCQKKDLIAALHKHAGLSRRKAEALIVKYTGLEPSLSKWSFEVRDHGAHCYYLLIMPNDTPNDTPADVPDETTPAETPANSNPTSDFI